MTTKQGTFNSSSNSAISSESIMKTDVKPNIGVEDKSREKIVEILNSRLCDEYMFYTYKDKEVPLERNWSSLLSAP